jgi:hypothetical protein
MFQQMFTFQVAFCATLNYLSVELRCAEVSQLTGFLFPCADKFPRKNGKHYSRGHIQSRMCPKIIPSRTHPAGSLSARQPPADNICPFLTNNPAFAFYSTLITISGGFSPHLPPPPTPLRQLLETAAVTFYFSYFLLSANCQSLFALRDNQGACRAGKAKWHNWHSAAVSSPVVAETVATQRHAPYLPQYDMAQMTRFGGASRPSRKSFQRQFRHLCHIY